MLRILRERPIDCSADVEVSILCLRLRTIVRVVASRVINVNPKLSITCPSVTKTRLWWIAVISCESKGKGNDEALLDVHDSDIFEQGKNDSLVNKDGI